MRFAPAQLFPVSATTTSTSVYVGAAILHGWAYRETTDTTRAELELRDGASGPVVVPITLLAGESTRDWLGDVGIYVRTGLYVAVLSGTVQVSLWATPIEDASHVEPFDLHDAFDALLETTWQAPR